MKRGDRVVYIQNNDPLMDKKYIGKYGFIVQVFNTDYSYKYEVVWDDGEAGHFSDLEIKPHNYHIYRLIAKYYEV